MKKPPLRKDFVPATRILACPGAFVSDAGGKLQAIAPGAMNEFQCLALSKETFEALRRRGYIEATPKRQPSGSRRWRAKEAGR